MTPKFLHYTEDVVMCCLFKAYHTSQWVTDVYGAMVECLLTQETGIISWKTCVPIFIPPS
jgi:hypothetical protein